MRREVEFVSEKSYQQSAFSAQLLKKKDQMWSS